MFYLHAVDTHHNFENHEKNYVIDTYLFFFSKK